MPVSTTTFEERLARINNGQTQDVAAQVGLKKKKTRTFRSRCLTFPFLVGVGILTGGTAYAWAAQTPEMHWVLDLAANPNFF